MRNCAWIDGYLIVEILFRVLMTDAVRDLFGCSLDSGVSASHQFSRHVGVGVN